MQTNLKPLWASDVEYCLDRERNIFLVKVMLLVPWNDGARETPAQHLAFTQLHSSTGRWTPWQQLKHNFCFHYIRFQCNFVCRWRQISYISLWFLYLSRGPGLISHQHISLTHSSMCDLLRSHTLNEKGVFVCIIQWWKNDSISG